MDKIEGVTDYLSHWRTGRIFVSILWLVSGIVDVIGLWGLLFRGLRFLGAYATYSCWIILFLILLVIVIFVSFGLPLLRRTKYPLWPNVRSRIIPLLLPVLTVIITVLIMVRVLRFDIIHAGQVAHGQLGVAVAEFGLGSEMRTSPQGRELSAFTARNLRQRIDLLPGLVGRVTIISAPLIRNETEARDFARRNNVQLVLWGWIAETQSDTIVPSVTFYEPEEFNVGLDEIPPWLDVEITGYGSVGLSYTIAARASGLIEYVMGLVFLNEGEYDQAVAEFQRAISLTEAESHISSLPALGQGQFNRSLAIYHLALGRTYAAQGYSEQALHEFERAQGYDSNYGPIYIGLGNLEYGRGDCQAALPAYSQAVSLAALRIHTKIPVW